MSNIIFYRGAVRQMHDLICTQCDIPFSIPLDFAQERGTDGAIFHCPRGHQQHFGESELEKSKREVARLKRELDAKAPALTAALCEVRNERHKREVVEAKYKRIAGGKCPCCKKVFKVLARHVAAMHPNFVKEAAR